MGKYATHATAARELVLEQKRAYAIELKLTEDLEYQEIAAKIVERFGGKCSTTRAWELVNETVRERTRANAEELHAEQERDLQEIWAPLIVKYQELSNRTDLEAIYALARVAYALVRVLERKARLNGLDKPIEHTITGTIAHGHEHRHIAQLILGSPDLARDGVELLQRARLCAPLASGARDAGGPGLAASGAPQGLDHEPDRPRDGADQEPGGDDAAGPREE